MTTISESDFMWFWSIGDMDQNGPFSKLSPWGRAPIMQRPSTTRPDDGPAHRRPICPWPEPPTSCFGGQFVSGYVPRYNHRGFIFIYFYEWHRLRGDTKCNLWSSGMSIDISPYFVCGRYFEWRQCALWRPWNLKWISRSGLADTAEILEFWKFDVLWPPGNPWKWMIYWFCPWWTQWNCRRFIIGVSVSKTSQKEPSHHAQGYIKGIAVKVNLWGAGQCVMRSLNIRGLGALIYPSLVLCSSL